MIGDGVRHLFFTRVEISQTQIQQIHATRGNIHNLFQTIIITDLLKQSALRSVTIGMSEPTTVMDIHISKNNNSYDIITK